MQNYKLDFKNGNFRILQFADIQEQHRINPNTVNLMNACLDSVKPDLVVLSGDQIKGYALDLKGRHGKQRAVTLIRRICNPMIERGIPFTATFGNHDSECGISNAEQFEIYKQLPGFVWDTGPGEGDEGTFCLEIGESFLIYLFDSHAKDGKGGFGAVHPNQIEWYKSVRDKYESIRGEVVPSLAFQHIPTPEFFEVIKKTHPFSSKSIRAYGDHKNQWYELDPFNSGLRDFMGEAPATSFVNSGEIEAFLEKKDVKALFVGHDHNNSFTAAYGDIMLCFTQGCSFSAYGPGLNRGARYIDLKPNGQFTTRTVTYRELLGTQVEKKLTYALYEISPISIAGTVTALRESAIVLGIAGSAAAIYKAIKKK